ncbi:MAG: acetylglutamate kinase [Pseudomonadota bacterium]
MGEMTFRDRASLLLGGLEEGREVRAYLRRFSAKPDGCFAVVKVGGAILQESLDPLADALALLQFLGLPPVVVFGAGPQLNEDLKAAGIEEKRVDGLRVTPSEAMPLVAKAVGDMAVKLTAAMRDRGASASFVPQGVLRAREIDAATYGAVGDIDHVDADGVMQLANAGTVPLVGCVHPDHKGRLLNVNADGIARSICDELKPQKIVFVTGTGGLLGPTGKRIDTVNLATDRENLFAGDWLHGGMAHKLREIMEILEGLPLSSSVSVTSAQNVVRELFTHTGAGTLIRKGEAIEHITTPNKTALTELIENAFRQSLRPGFWENLPFQYALVSEHSRGAAVVTEIDGVAVLDKFAVLGSARGEGLSKALWRRLVDASPEIVWRSRVDNPFNAFYHSKADGFVRRGMWRVYWVGPGLEARVHQLADLLGGRPPDFEDPQ